MKKNGTTRVSGLVNGSAEGSIFSGNPKGWFKVTVEIDLNLVENKDKSLEELFFEYARKKITFMQIRHVAEVQFETVETRSSEDESFVIDDDF